MTVPHALLAFSAVLVSSVVLAVICPPHWQPWVQFTAASLVACAVTGRQGRPLLPGDGRPGGRSAAASRP